VMTFQDRLSGNKSGDSSHGILLPPLPDLYRLNHFDACEPAAASASVALIL